MAEGEGGKKFGFPDRLLNALSAFGVTDLNENEHYVLFLASRLFEAERAYEEQMDRLHSTCQHLYGDERGTEIYKRLLNS